MLAGERNALPSPVVHPFAGPALPLHRPRSEDSGPRVTPVCPPGIEMTTLSPPVMTLLEHMSRSDDQSGSLKDRYTFSGAGQGLRSAAQTWVPESKAPEK